MLLTSLPRHLTSRRGAWITLICSLLLAVAVIGGLRGAEVVNDHGAAPPASESARAGELLAELPGADVQHLVLVTTRADGTALTEEDLGMLGRLGGQLPTTGDVAGPIPSSDGLAALLQVPVSVDGEDSGALRELVDEVRTTVAAELPDTLTVETTGGPAFGADLAASFDGANVRLLLITVGIVALLLLLTYRSPVLWLVPVAVVGLADQVAAVLTARLGAALDLNFDAGIISVLVFGAGANYALLLISRYREELRRHEDHRQALAVAWRGTVPAILASNISVVLALATLVLATIPGTRGIGVAAAVGLLVALAAALLALPAALAVVGRGAFWPFVPRPAAGDDAGTSVTADARPSLRRDPWGAVATAVARRPWQVLGAGAVLLAVMATGLIGTEVGLSQTERFRVAAESADGLETIAEHFPAGSAQPLLVVARTQHADAVEQAAAAVSGVRSVGVGASAPSTAGDITTLSVISDAAPGSEHERDVVQDLRAAVHGVPGAEALVGGAPATDVDVRAGAESDLWLIAPLVLAVVALTLALLLRSLVAPVVLLGINIASTLATIGAGAWLGRQLFGFPALDTPVPVLAFLFLVALGIDYTIFLVHRVRHEAAQVGTRAAVVHGVRTTGVVITSAGIVLAGVFAALGILPLVTLGQLGLIVSLGVVVDTLVVRTLLVPALITVLGERFWWPSRPSHAVGSDDVDVAATEHALSR
ncbi:MMPL family transporter [Georgenia satyanarayanai]|uniref:MMPL family transporter n=1 Tax=Georgenia satyanarayanai TaxID=860221 RepID=UPI00203DC34E|nr:MMPL family transporter [Georgenia satyanarayanai]MCM3660651.1 MMPL family transporter [Georgenia satyanarayanai]